MAIARGAGSLANGRRTMVLAADLRRWLKSLPAVIPKEST